MELQKWASENTDNRLDKEIRVYDFRQTWSPRRALTMRLLGDWRKPREEIDHALGDTTTICKNLCSAIKPEMDFIFF